ncbi:sarcosine oxidase subunit alpha family protein [Tropicimonas sp. S265A]|uniref:sarcosine oxidase subunit alpha family protein n=1 Tax=Tropicimonas sp. S265A TaxID=3415134 RepID=UPI003C7C12E9
MSGRLNTGGRLIDRSQRVAFTFNGRAMRGYAGDTLASALLGAGQTLLGRSFKYHRPRGVVASGAEEPNALLTIGTGGRMEPNQRATTTELFDGITARSQNHWPSLEYDIGTLNAKVEKFLPAGFYYKTFIHPRPFWKHLFEPVIRQSAGLGPAPTDRDEDHYEHLYHHTDVLVVGGGVAGLQAAMTAAAGGARVLVIEQTANWGGRAPVDGGVIDGQGPDGWIKATREALEKMENVTLRARCMGAGVYDHGYALACERVADHTPGDGRPRHRLWRIRAKQIVTATGALERPLSFSGNDVPGVMLASAVRDYVTNFAVAPGQCPVIVTNNDDAYRTALTLLDAGLTVPAVLDTRATADGVLPALARARGVQVKTGRGIARVLGGARVTGVAVCHAQGDGAEVEEIACDCVAMSGGWSPVVHLWSHCGGKLSWDAARVCFKPDPAKAPTGADGLPFVIPAGAASGAQHLGAALVDAAEAGALAAQRVGHPSGVRAPVSEAPQEDPSEPVWLLPSAAGPELRSKMFLDYQNDVKVSDVQLAAQEGFESVEHTKRYTTLGMATDQGKLSNINGLGVLSGALGVDIPEVGTTTFRPPYTPISMGAIAGEARAELFQPVRQTPLHDWHDAHGAYCEPVGHWRRPYCFLQGDETPEQAVTREVLATRTGVGLLDASTLGKILVKGPDAGRFLDMLYTNMMSTLPVGKCRYGLMCSENGFLMDDGVVARLSEDTWLCHTTTGGADHIHAHMEDWLQCEWWDWQVFTQNVTEQYGQIAVVGPKARDVLQGLGGIDVSRSALPFMQFVDGDLAGIPVRVFRISFSGELSYEIAAPAGQTRALWDKLLKAGEPHGITPYGTEALHVMRAEKGFIMIGDETDGTVIPQDLNLDWALSKKKDDYLGKRAHLRAHMANPDRWKLVGLETLDASVLPDGAYIVGAGRNANGQRVTEGRVTSSYRSPTLKRGIAMALLHRGPERLGEVVQATSETGGRIAARVVDPVFYDKNGDRQNV